MVSPPSSPSRPLKSPSRSNSSISPSPLVSRTLSLKPFKTASPRRDLTNSLDVFRAAWSSLIRCDVYGERCRRVGERAAAILGAVWEKLDEVERKEEEELKGTIRKRRGYEFEEGVTGVDTIFKIQSFMTDLQFFSTSFSSQLLKSRQEVLLSLSPHSQSLDKLATSLHSIISFYSLPISTSTWKEEDEKDQRMDKLALPRLFKISVTMKGASWDVFLRSNAGGGREDFIEWVYNKNPLLRPDPNSPTRRKWSAPPPVTPSPTTSKFDRGTPPPATSLQRSKSEFSPHLPPPTSVPLVRSISSPFVPTPIALPALTTKDIGICLSPVEVEASKASSGAKKEDEKQVVIEVKNEREVAKDHEEVVQEVQVPHVVQVAESTVGGESAKQEENVAEEVEETKEEDPIGKEEEEKVEHVKDVQLEEPKDEVSAIEQEEVDASPCASPSPNPLADETKEDPNSPLVDVQSPTPPKSPVVEAKPPSSSTESPTPTLSPAPKLTIRPATPLEDLAETSPLFILSLDGGGIRGLPLLYTLRSLLGSHSPKPCEIFHLITGVSTGGLVAILLGRLKLSLDEAIEVYIEIAKKAFLGKDRTTKSRWSKLFSGGGGGGGESMRDTNLDKALEMFLPELEMMMAKTQELDGDPEVGRTAILAYGQSSEPRWFRSHGPSDKEKLSVRHVARASLSSSSQFFKTFHQYGGASRTSLNPSNATLDEVHRTFGGDVNIGCFLSIGVGRIYDARLSSKTKAKSLRAIAQLATNAQGTAERFGAKVAKEGWGERYLRVNVDLGQNDPGLEEWLKKDELKKAVERMVSIGKEVQAVRKLMGGGEANGHLEVGKPKRKTSLAKKSPPEFISPLRTSISLDDLRPAALYLHSSGSTGSF